VKRHRVSLCGETTKDHYREDCRDGPGSGCLVGVLDALRNAEAAGRIKQAAETIYQAPIDAELTAVIGRPPRTHRGQNQPAQRISARTISTTAGDLELRPLHNDHRAGSAAPRDEESAAASTIRVQIPRRYPIVRTSLLTTQSAMGGVLLIEVKRFVLLATVEGDH
jgi:hypothetical protein